MKTYKYIGAIIAVLILIFTITLMTINDLVILCKLEPVDAHNLLATQQAILFTLIKTIVFSYVTYYVVIELYYEVHVKPAKVKDLIRKMSKERVEWTSSNNEPIIKDRDFKFPDVNNLNFEPLYEQADSIIKLNKEVEDYMNTIPNMNDIGDEEDYYKVLNIWVSKLPRNIFVNWHKVYTYFSSRGHSENRITDEEVPKEIRDLLDLGYRTV